MTENEKLHELLRSAIYYLGRAREVLINENINHLGNIHDKIRRDVLIEELDLFDTELYESLRPED